MVNGTTSYKSKIYPQRPEAPSRRVISINNGGDCIYHTMHFAATKKILNETELLEEKKKVGKMWQAREAIECSNEGRRILNKLREKTMEAQILSMRDQDVYTHYLDQLLNENHGTITTIAAYAQVLRKNVRIYMFGKYFDLYMKTENIAINDNNWERYKEHWLTFYVRKQADSADHAHIHWIPDDDLREGRAIKIFTEDYTRSEGNPWTEGEATGVEWIYTHVKTYRPFWQKEKYISVGGEYWKDFEDQKISGLDDEREAKYLTKETNTTRNAHGQSNLLDPINGQSSNESAHDTGGYGRAKTIYTLSNELRKLAGQELLTPSMSNADMDMYALNLHKEDEIRMFKTDTEYVKEESEIFRPTNTQNTDEYVPQMIYLSRIASSRAPGAETFSALWDSGATNTVIGRGPQAERLMNGYVVIHNDTNGGWATAQNLESKELHTPIRENRRIVVASGAVVPGKSVSQVNLLVKARTLQKDGKWSEDTDEVFIQTREATVSNDIPSTVFAEGHFMRENTDWTLITHADEKYLVNAELDIKYKSIGGRTPMRIDLRNGKGGHYLDIITAVTDLGLVNGQENPITQIQDGINQTQNKEVSISMMTVEENNDYQNHCHSVATDTDEIVSYEETIETNFKQREQRFSDTAQSQGESCPTTQPCQEMEKCLAEVHRLTEDPESTAEERFAAIEHMQTCMHKLKRWTNYYGNRKADMKGYLNAITTRKQKLNQTNETKEPKRESELSLTETNESQEVESVEETYQDYDRHFKASQETKRRVRFQQEVEQEHEEMIEMTQSRIPTENERKNTRNVKRSTAKTEKDRSVAKTARGLQEGNETKNEPQEKYDMYKNEDYVEVTKGGNQVYRDDKFSDSTSIEQASDFTLGVYMMENNISV
jgi:uncharacterized protein YacL (UPF0231 family)